MAAGTLYVVATPIGNLGDFSPRAESTLREADLIAAEDTRHTGTLLKKLGITTPMLSYHEHNERTRAVELVQKLQAGAQIALVSDAGTPTISDPGYRVVRAAGNAGIKVVSIPGPSSVLAALAASGMATDRFLFEGFLPRKKGRKARLDQLVEFPGSVVIFEAANRLERTLHDLQSRCPDREIALARELTKKFETILRSSVSGLLEHIAGKTMKGECVLVLGKEDILSAEN